MLSKEFEGVYSGTKGCLWHMAVLVIFIGGAVQAGLHGYFGTCVMLGVTGLFLLMALIGNCTENWGTGTKKIRNWQENSLRTFEGNVPEYVLRGACDIKTRVPTAEFSVHYLQESTSYREPRQLPDPILRVKTRNENYFIYVWDEKEYKEL
jgi:hypothetical protein